MEDSSTSQHDSQRKEMLPQHKKCVQGVPLEKLQLLVPTEFLVELLVRGVNYRQMVSRQKLKVS